MKKKIKKKRIKYHKPPMKYNVALHKFEPDLPIIEKGSSENRILTIPLAIAVAVIIIGLAVILYLMSQVR